MVDPWGENAFDPSFPGKIIPEVWAANCAEFQRVIQKNLDAFLLTDLYNLIERNHRYGALAADTRRRFSDGAL